MKKDVYAGFRNITWADVQRGDIIFIDNYQNGKFPRAEPRISGPFFVIDLKMRRLRSNNGRTFMHYPDNLLFMTEDE